MKTIALCFCACILPLCSVRPSRADGPPPARVEDVAETMHGATVHDPYRWLEKGDDPPVQAWVKAQNDYMHSMLDKAPWRDKLAAELRRYNDVTYSDSPSVHKDRYFFSRREGLKNHAIIYVRDGKYDAAPRVLIDPNTFSESGTVALDWMFPSVDGSLVAYGKSESGSEKSTLYVKDVKTGRDLKDTIPYTRFCSVAWDQDGKGFYYTRYAAPGSVPKGDENYYRKVYHHGLGDDWQKDAVVYGNGRPKEETADVSLSSDERHLFLTRSLVWTKNDVFMKDLEKGGTLTKVCDGLEGLTSADVWNGEMFVLTSVGAPRYHVCKTTPDKPTKENWKEIIPQGKGVIQGMSIIGGKLVLTVMEDVCSHIRVYSTDGKLVDEIKLPTLGAVSGVSGKPEDPSVFFEFQSFAYPTTVFRYELDSHKLGELDHFICNGSDKIVSVGHDPHSDVQLSISEKSSRQLNMVQMALDCETKQVWYTSKDGTKVPMFVVYKKGLKLDGNNPTLLYGYGGFDISMTPSFRAARYVWLDRGGVYAVANLRGGGEFGQAWHHAGRLEHKQNVFDDFIAAGQWLIDNKYTSKDHLAIMGGSNGGLLTGAVLVQRPDLFAAVVCAVPLLDMIRYPNYQIARLWIQEYGDPSKDADFKWLYAYSPYHNVKKGTKFPAVLFETADSDGRVDPMHARKMTALVQASNTGDRPIMLRTDFAAGHGAGKPLTKIIEQQTDEWVFLMTQTGMKWE